MLGRIEEIVDNSVIIKLAININQQPSLINLHVVFEDGTNKKIVAEIVNVNQTQMVANIVGEIVGDTFEPGSSYKPSFKAVGGTERLKKYLIANLRREVKKYL